MFGGRLREQAARMQSTSTKEHHARVTQHRSTGRTLERPAPQDRHPRLDRVRGPGLHGRRQPSGRTRSTQDQAGVGDSGQASKIVAEALPGQASTSRSSSRARSLKADSTRVPGRVADVEKRLERTKGVKALHGPYDQKEPSRDLGRRAFGARQLRDQGRPQGRRGRRRRSTRHWPRPRPPRSRTRDFNVEQFGSGSSEEQFMEVFDKDLQRRPSASLPITLILLVIAFGTLVAAGIPLLLAITGSLGTMGLVGPLSHLAPVEDSIMHVILLIGLAVGVDYALFYLRRVREERAAGREQGSGHRGGRRHVGPGRAGLGLHRDDRDGRHVPGRSAHVHLVRHRHDRGGRGGDDRIAHRAARRAVGAGRPGREGPGPAARPPPRPGGQGGHLVAHRGPGAAPPAALGRPGHGAAGGDGAPGARSWTWARPSTSASLPQDEPVVQTFNRVQKAFPAENAVAERGRQGRGRDGAGRHRRPGGARAGRRGAQVAAPGDGPEHQRQPRQDRGDGGHGDRRRRHRREVGPGPGRAPGRGRAAHASDRSTASSPTSTARPRRTGTSPTR